MAYFDSVAESIYIGIGSLHVIVYGDATPFSDGESCLFGQFGFRAYSDTQQNHVGSDLFATAEVYGHTTVFFFKTVDTIFQVQSDSLIGQLPVYDCCH